MADVAFAIPGDLATRTGGYGYDRRILAGLPAAGLAVRHLALPAGFPWPDERDLAAAERLLAAQPPGSILLIDGLAYGALPLRVIDRIGGPVVALVHHPLCLEAGLTADQAARLRASETAALARADQVVVTSPSTAALLTAEFKVAAARITIAMPGTDEAPRAAGGGGPEVALLAVGAAMPRKAYDLLVRALAPLRGFAWRLTLAGSLDRDPAAAGILRAAIAETDLAARIELAGEVDETSLPALYHRADVFVSPSLFEGYGMALADALAHGLPIICTTGGAAADTAPDAAAIKVPPGDGPVLTEALRQLIGDPALRRRLADAAWGAGKALPRWPDTVAAVAAAVRRAQHPTEPAR